VTTPAPEITLDPPPDTEMCEWPISYLDCSGGCAEVWANWDDPAAAQAWFEALAVEWLWNWTGHLFGVCEVSVRPCHSDCAGGPSPDSTFWGRGPGYDPGFPRRGRGGTSTGGWTPILLGGKWFNVSCGCIGSCSCMISGAHALRLPGPIQSVSEVRIDGVILPASAYRVDHKSLLVRTDGGTWPACQNLLAEPTEENTFEVTYQRGLPAPLGGQVAAGRLACEMAMAACDDDECALPERIQTITRQGLTVAVQLDGEDFGTTTGIWSIDSWVDSVTQPKHFASVRSVDIPPTSSGW
jgi:hypothetical protein